MIAENCMRLKTREEAISQLTRQLSESNRMAASAMVDLAAYCHHNGEHDGIPVVTTRKDGGEVSVRYADGWYEIT